MATAEKASQLISSCVNQCIKQKHDIRSVLQDLYIILQQVDDFKLKVSNTHPVLKAPGASDILKTAGFSLIDDQYVYSPGIDLQFLKKEIFERLCKIASTATPDNKQTYRPVLKKYKLCGTLFEISARYKVRALVGKGGYGLVCLATDEITGKKVAIKKIPKLFSHILEHQKRVLRELKIMKHFRKHPSIVGAIDLIAPASYKKFKDLYIVMEYMDIDLRTLLRTEERLRDADIQYFLYMILKALKHVHSCDVIHRDIKPCNILINENMEVKLCDFNLSRGVNPDKPNNATQYVVTRWYRPPEVLMECNYQTSAVDVWSAGCILGELLSEPPRYPLFRGDSTLKQLELIFEILGTPPDEQLVMGSREAVAYAKSLKKREKKDFRKLFPDASMPALDLLQKMLKFDPFERISVDDALRHPYLQKMYKKSDFQQQYSRFDHSFDEKIDTKDPDAIKKILYDEVMEWNKIENHLEGDAITSEEIEEVIEEDDDDY